MKKLVSRAQGLWLALWAFRLWGQGESLMTGYTYARVAFYLVGVEASTVLIPLVLSPFGYLTAFERVTGTGLLVARLVVLLLAVAYAAKALRSFSVLAERSAVYQGMLLKSMKMEGPVQG